MFESDLGELLKLPFYTNAPSFGAPDTPHSRPWGGKVQSPIRGLASPAQILLAECHRVQLTLRGSLSSLPQRWLQIHVKLAYTVLVRETPRSLRHGAPHTHAPIYLSVVPTGDPPRGHCPGRRAQGPGPAPSPATTSSG